MTRNLAITFLLILFALFVFHCTTTKQYTSAPAPKRHSLPRDSAGRIVVRSNPAGTYLSPQESLGSIYVPEGYHLQLVASEPMIKEPVAIAWDGNGRMFVSEMLTYMQDVDGTRENDPVSRISLLEDTDGDGVMDKSSVYIDSLLLPRMILCAGKQLLVSETYTNNIWAYEDLNDDGKADRRSRVFGNDKPHTGNLEHQRSGLIWNLDNRIYVTYENLRYRYSRGKLLADTMFTGSGQWGVGNDDYGRLYFSSAGGEVPAYGFQINPFYGSYDVPGQLDGDFNAVWPVIATPDVQGGAPRLRPDSTLNHFTGCCGQSIFRGTALPDDLKGDLLICEPVGRLIRRAKVDSRNGIRALRNAYRQEEFITSTDMNFRPVNTATGPDGCLYIVDMHRGIIQEGNWTRAGSYLRPQILKRGLDKNVGHGRIYRLVHDDFQPGFRPEILRAPANQLVDYLSHANGWVRDNAQKELVVRGERSVIPALRAMAGHHPVLLARLHALWTLEGLDAVDMDVLGSALKDTSGQLRKAAVNIAEQFLKNRDENVLRLLSPLVNDPDEDVQTQLAATLSYYEGGGPGTLLEKLLANTGQKRLKDIAGLVEKNRNQKLYGVNLAGLADDQKKVILKGREAFLQVCATCHGNDGKGIQIGGNPMPAPPLINSKRAGKRDALIGILLHGLTGPVDGKTYPDVMAPLGAANSDEWVADVLSYVHYRFRPGGSNFAVIGPDEVKRIRAMTQSRTEMFTVKELDSLKFVTTGGKEKAPAAIAVAKKKTETTVPSVKAADPVAAEAKRLLAKQDCSACHKPAVKLVGPSYKAIAQKYRSTDTNIHKLAAKVISGGVGSWGQVPMPPHAALNVTDARKIVRYILTIQEYQ
ncbi:cytochrome C [Chitinophaga lutea]|uniref:Cytochrome C n=1 Tax=Chitinophaga lutea TaxID=2488634 RepID=A0A3N4PZP2_9BACT|nr:cytochrome C [Chitinophaga lutea]